MLHRHRYAILWLTLALTFAAVGCAGGDARFAARPAGFWAGLWHGAISLVAFVVSLFSERVHMYEVRNAGGWYDFGFLLGVMIVYGGSRWSKRSRRC